MTNPSRLAAQARVLLARWRVPLLAAMVVVLLAGVGLSFLGPKVRPAARRTAIGSTSTAAVPTIAVPNLFRPVAPDEALKQNEARAVTARPDQPAAAFRLGKTDVPSKERALECLTQAVYYEAASESLDGQRAVAQVVINRVHHAGFPPTVCETVYQGSDRPTGCQFTFTCDGSLSRTPIQSLWQRARRVASDALAGHVFAPVGHATHYHADYVLPYWADSLDKEVQIGRHIFYRLRGRLGATSAFGQHYAGHEAVPASPSAVEVAIAAVADAEKEESASALPMAPTPDTPALPKQPPLSADENRGTLRFDAPPLTPPKATPESAPCPVNAPGKPLQPASATGTKVGIGKAVDCR